MSTTEFNYLEAALWLCIALGLATNAFRAGKSSDYFNVLIIAAIAFVAFGISDIIEVQTGA